MSRGGAEHARQPQDGVVIVCAGIAGTILNTPDTPGSPAGQYLAVVS